MILAKYNPQEVFKHFEAISQIPRGSGNEKAVSDYIANFATSLGHKVVQDKLHNLIIYKSGTLDSAPVILQAHLDMVCEKNTDTTHDFLHDPINLYIDGDYIKAKGTTLGADNGLGVAMCMALLTATDIPHPPLEIVLTSEEETGMDGAKGLDFSQLSGKRMINLDNSNDSTFVMGCAAGTTLEFRLPSEWVAVAADNIVLSIAISGLTGGHSGGDITKERGNALRILGHVLSALEQQVDIGITNICGGMKVNAIPREATATVVFPQNEMNKVTDILEQCKNNFAEQYRTTDKNLNIYWESAMAEKSLSAHIGRNLTALLTLIPNGVQHMSFEIDGLVNASCNVGVATTSTEYIQILAMARGAAGFYNRQMEAQAYSLARLVGAELTFSQRSPAWPYNPNSELLKVALEHYVPIYGQEANVAASHGGLECGVFVENIDGIDIIAFGATAHDLHTPDERASISSVEKTWEFVKSLLGAL